MTPGAGHCGDRRSQLPIPVFFLISETETALTVFFRYLANAYPEFDLAASTLIGLLPFKLKGEDLP